MMLSLIKLHSLKVLTGSESYHFSELRPLTYGAKTTGPEQRRLIENKGKDLRKL